MLLVCAGYVSRFLRFAKLKEDRFLALFFACCNPASLAGWITSGVLIAARAQPVRSATFFFRSVAFSTARPWLRQDREALERRLDRAWRAGDDALIWPGIHRRWTSCNRRWTEHQTMGRGRRNCGRRAPDGSPLL